MRNDTLWAPWRLGYVQGGADPASGVEPRVWRPGADHACFLCRAAAAESADLRALGVVERTAHAIVMANRFPYSNGHLLVAPLDHRATLADLGDDVLIDLQRRLADWCGILGRTLQAEGFNLGLNLGTAAGAGVPGHLHWHLVPRWPGDINFMATVAGVRVLPQALDALWEQLTSVRGTPG